MVNNLMTFADYARMVGRSHSNLQYWRKKGRIVMVRSPHHKREVVDVTQTGRTPWIKK